MRRILLFALLQLSSMLAVAGPVDFTLTGLNGEDHSLSDYRGKWVVVNFWATWCPPCLEEIPELIGFHDKHHAEDAVVLGINFERIDAEQLADFVDDYLISYPVLLSDARPVAPFGSPPGLPATYIISPEGEVAGHYLGGIDADRLERFIEAEQRAAGERS